MRIRVWESIGGFRFSMTDEQVAFCDALRVWPRDEQGNQYANWREDIEGEPTRDDGWFLYKYEDALSALNAEALKLEKRIKIVQAFKRAQS